MLTMRTLNGRSLGLVIAAGSMITAISLGARSTFGLYLDPVVETLGTDRGTFSLVIAVQNLLWGLSQPLAGAVADRFGAARVLGAGGVGYAVSLLIMSQAQSTGVLFLSAGVLIGIATGAASFSVVLAAVGRMAPPQRVSMALGIVTAMGSVGQFVLVPLVGELLDRYGWRITVSLLSMVVVTVAGFTWPLRGRAIDQQQQTGEASTRPAVPLRSDLRRAAHSRSYLMLNAAFFVCGFHVTFIGIHLVAYGGDVGVSEGNARFALALIGLFNIIGSLVAGFLGSRFRKTYLLSIIYGLRAISITAFVLLPATTTTFIAFGATIGLLWLSTVPLTGGIVASQFGTTHSGTLFGIVFLSHQLGSFTGVWLGGELADRPDGYTTVWWIAVGLGVLAAVLHLGIDESPAPQPPAAGDRRIVLSPAGGVAAVMLTVGGVAAVQPPRAMVADGTGEVLSHLCVLHPVDGN
jgi:predicted MFS family arabinose efflux permease